MTNPEKCSSNPDLTRVNPLFISWLTLGRLKPLVEKWSMGGFQNLTHTVYNIGTMQ
jgi:hypothetical protein